MKMALLYHEYLEYVRKQQRLDEVHYQNDFHMSFTFTGLNQCSPDPCMNGGTCDAVGSRCLDIICRCPQCYVGERCQTSKGPNRHYFPLLKARLH